MCFPYPLYLASQKDCLGKVLKSSRGGGLVFRGYRAFLFFLGGPLYIVAIFRGRGLYVLFVYFEGGGVKVSRSLTTRLRDPPPFRMFLTPSHTSLKHP